MTDAEQQDEQQDEQPDEEWQAEELPPEGAETADVWMGFGLALLLHLLQLVLSPLTGGKSLMMIGLWQLVYLVPAIVICGIKGRKSMAKGIFIAMAMTFLVNATCNGLGGVIR